MSSQKKKLLEISRTERLLLLPLDLCSPESKVGLSLVDPPGSTLLASRHTSCLKHLCIDLGGWMVLRSHFLCVWPGTLFYLQGRWLFIPPANGASQRRAVPQMGYPTTLGSCLFLTPLLLPLSPALLYFQIFHSTSLGLDLGACACRRPGHSHRAALPHTPESFLQGRKGKPGERSPLETVVFLAFLKLAKMWL